MCEEELYSSDFSVLVDRGLMPPHMEKIGDEPGWGWWLWERCWGAGLGLYEYFVRAAVKWFLHVFTGKCELERILDGQPKGARRTLAIEASLGRSKRPDLRQALQIPVAAVPALVALVCKVKHVSGKAKGDFEPRLRLELTALLGYAQLCREVEWARKVAYDSANEAHEALLLRLWALMQPGRELSARKSKDWQDIGFQGQDPATDFRGMGVLGLEQMVWLFEELPEEARRVFRLSLHPVFGFPFAIGSITITAMTRNWFASGLLKAHCFGTLGAPLGMEDFHGLYSHVLRLFAKHWLDWNPASIMEFNVAKDDFQTRTLAYLRQHDTLPEPLPLQI